MQTFQISPSITAKLRAGCRVLRISTICAATLWRPVKDVIDGNEIVIKRETMPMQTSNSMSENPSFWAFMAKISQGYFVSY